jgi:hypothetical protein
MTHQAVLVALSEWQVRHELCAADTVRWVACATFSSLYLCGVAGSTATPLVACRCAELGWRGPLVRCTLCACCMLCSLCCIAQSLRSALCGMLQFRPRMHHQVDDVRRMLRTLLGVHSTFVTPVVRLHAARQAQQMWLGSGAQCAHCWVGAAGSQPLCSGRVQLVDDVRSACCARSR